MPAGSILVADDDAAIRTVLNQALSRAGYEVRSTSNAATLWRWISQGEGDLVITDVVMPQMDGPSTLARIRTMPGHEHTPVIFMTARTQPQEQSRYIALCAIGVISKPFDPMTLGQQVRAILAEAPR